MKWLKRHKRLIIAALCSPILGALMSGNLVILMSVTSEAMGGPFYLSFYGLELIGFLQIQMLLIILGAIIGWPAIILMGLPLHRLFIAKWAGRLIAYLIGGTVSGFLAWYLVGVWETGELYLRYADKFVLYVISPLTGLTSALSFWLIRRPDHINKA